MKRGSRPPRSDFPGLSFKRCFLLFAVSLAWLSYAQGPFLVKLAVGMAGLVIPGVLAYRASASGRGVPRMIRPSWGR